MDRFVLLCGPSAAGKTTVGYALFSRIVAEGRHAAFVDLDQLQLCRPEPDDDWNNLALSATNLGAVWPNFRAAGATHLVASGIAYRREQLDAYRAAVPGVVSVVCRLRARPDTIRERMALRAAGGGPPLAGDRVRGSADDAVERMAIESIAEADQMEADALGEVVVDTDGLGVDEVVAAVRRVTGM